MNALPPGYVPAEENDENCERVRREATEKLRRVGPGWAGLHKARRLFDYAFDRSRPWRRRALAIGALLYLVCPLDGFPDFLPGGLLDDLLVVAFVAAQVLDEFCAAKEVPG